MLQLPHTTVPEIEFDTARLLEGLAGACELVDCSQETPPVVDDYLTAIGLMVAINVQNNPAYGDSWCKRGASGIFHNIARKFDRMEQQVVRERRDAEANEVVDLGVYAWMNLAWYIRNRPGLVLEWARRELREHPHVAGQ